MNLAAE